jgi:branched-subunit amino acid aminotransferase/4-amino-4-deoxychorismate lyase
MSNSNWYWLNDEWCTIDLIPNPANFTEGGFESVFYSNGIMPLFLQHYQRLSNGLQKDYQLTLLPPPSYLQEIIHQLVQKNNVQGAAKIRLTVFKIGMEESWNLLLECLPVKDAIYTFGDQAWQCILFEATSEQLHHHYKHIERSLYLAASTKAKSKGYDDAIIVNEEGQLVESSIGNIFYFKHNQWFTPPLNKGGIAGVMRNLLIELLAAEERPLLKDELATLSDLFICNAIRGIKPVGRIDAIQFDTKNCKDAFVKLAEWQQKNSK